MCRVLVLQLQVLVLTYGIPLRDPFMVTGSLFSVTGTPDHLGSVYGIPLPFLREPRITSDQFTGSLQFFTGTRISAKSLQPRC